MVGSYRYCPYYYSRRKQHKVAWMKICYMNEAHTTINKYHNIKVQSTSKDRPKRKLKKI